MCTVTYVPYKDGFCLISNRDEHQNRQVALLPSTYGDLLYPKDQDKNGSWIAAKANGDAIVLLNGAFIKHIPRQSYRKSRGKLLLEAIAASRPEVYFDSVDLSDIEPFTLVICTNGLLYECRWDGMDKHIQQLDAHQSQIWSSVTLYDATAQTKKAARFRLSATGDSAAIIDYHRKECLAGLISTVSITQIRVKNKQPFMTYHDLKAEIPQVQQFALANPKIPWLGLRIFLIKLFNWEYWPSYVIYTPVMFYWCWLSIKSRAIFFFNTANPGIKNGGFAMESKNSIYVGIPPAHCPQTILVKAGGSVKNSGIKFPMIAKPDIGQRGLHVKLLHTPDDLAHYAANSKVDFLLQEYISYPFEAGIFYCRMPGRNSGTITGIVGKELITVIGDGESTLQELLVKDPRYLLQIPALAGSALQKILPAGAVGQPAPYGNHCRGAKFIDLSGQIDHQLTQGIHKVCKKIPGFFYGRLDVKYNSWEELCAGEFKIIEVNGASSEPAHMYDPKHSIFFAWKEIMRHWGMLYKISKANRQNNNGLRSMTYRQGVAMIKESTQYVNLTNS